MSNFKNFVEYLNLYDVNMNVAAPMIYKLIYSSPKIYKKNEWLYEAYYDDIDYEGAEKYLQREYFKPEACSSFVKDGFCGRNYDWYYDDSVSLVIHVSAKEDRHASVGITSSVPRVTNTVMNDGKYNEMLDYAPCMVLDGMNDAKVYCNINVTPHDGENTTGTNPDKPPMCITMMPRIILDKANTAADALNLLYEYNIYCPHGEIISEEIHMMIADKTSVYCVEFIGNEIKIIDFSSSALKPVMTNFYLYNFDGNTATAYYKSENYDKATTTLTPHAMGLERYDILRAEFDKTGTYTVNDAIAAMRSIKYTNAYNIDSSLKWYSELSAKYPNKDLTIDSPIEDFDYYFIKMRELYDKRSRNIKNTWQTVHAAVYDLNSGKVYVHAQEDFDNTYIFTI